ncbi:hypothetical protein PtB15_16B324 [Puccinia triticina]|nr:hypothetical protein PtB15_16B324 [Puccinia triticina]
MSIPPRVTTPGEPEPSRASANGPREWRISSRAATSLPITNTHASPSLSHHRTVFNHLSVEEMDDLGFSLGPAVTPVPLNSSVEWLWKQLPDL